MGSEGLVLETPSPRDLAHKLQFEVSTRITGRFRRLIIDSCFLFRDFMHFEQKRTPRVLNGSFS